MIVEEALVEDADRNNVIPEEVAQKVGKLVAAVQVEQEELLIENQAIEQFPEPGNFEHIEAPDAGVNLENKLEKDEKLLQAHIEATLEIDGPMAE